MPSRRPGQMAAQRFLVRLGVMLVVVTGLWLYNAFDRPQPAALPPNVDAPPTTAQQAERAPLLISNLTLRDEHGSVIYRGDIDLSPTLERIASNERLRFPNDGSTFQNREKRLPRQRSGYYREWVVPTPGESGPGPQRIVTGAEGEAWYTSDHYRTFRRLPDRLHAP